MEVSQKPQPRSNDSMDLFAQTRSLRRKVIFWRRTAGLLLGGVGVFLVVVWNRGEIRKRDCYQALSAYAEIARLSKLRDQHPDILEQQWQNLAPDSASGIALTHYDLIVGNWSATSKAGEKLPLAVCREPHSAALSRGRHVLFRDDKGLHVEWIDEEAAAPIAAQAARDNH